MLQILENKLIILKYGPLLSWTFCIPYICLPFLPFYADEEGNRQNDNSAEARQTFFPLNMTRRRGNLQFPHITHLAYIRVTYSASLELLHTTGALHCSV
jgi:hypothetical protein